RQVTEPTFDCDEESSSFGVQTERICGPLALGVPSSGGRKLSVSRLHIVALVVSTAVLLALAFVCDHGVDDFFHAQRLAHSDWKALSQFMTRFGDWPFLILYAVVFFIAGVVWKSRRWKTLAIAMALACFLSGVTATTIRSVTGRTRPSATAPQG